MDESVQKPSAPGDRQIRRRKATGPRSKQGCRTCRIRRVKCDEKKPECTRCSSTGRWCEWFTESPTHEDYTSPTSDVDTRTEKRLVKTGGNKKILLPLPSSPYSDPEQYRSFQYFRTRTVPQLSGVFSSQFWDYVLLQATHHNDTLRHAVVALGALHERFEQSDPTVLKSNKDPVQGGYALKQYVQAISSLVKPTKESAAQVDVYLVACLLFASFETLRGHHASAIKHVQCGVSILAEIAQACPDGVQSTIKKPEHPLVPLELLAVIFTRLDTQVRQILGKSVFPFGIAKVWSRSNKCFCDEVPDTFEDIEEARNSLDYSWNDICQIFEDTYDRGVKLAVSQSHSAAWQRQRLLARCERWSEAVNNMIKEKFLDFSPQELRAAQMMKMLATLGTIVLQVCGPNSELTFDRYTQDYKRVVDLAEMVVKEDADKRRFGLDDSLYEDRKVLPRFQMDMGIIVALFETLWKCRDPVIRRRAIALLEDNPWQEGLWDGLLVAKCGHILVAVEEGKNQRNMIDGFVPEASRVSEVDIRFDLEDRRGYIKLRQPLAGPNMTPVYTHHVITWTRDDDGICRARDMKFESVSYAPTVIPLNLDERFVRIPQHNDHQYTSTAPVEMADVPNVASPMTV